MDYDMIFTDPAAKDLDASKVSSEVQAMTAAGGIIGDFTVNASYVPVVEKGNDHHVYNLYRI